MIFITVGTSDFQFNRLLKLIDELCEDKIIKCEDVFAQIGCSTYRPKKYKYKDALTNEEHKKYIKQSEFIITHAGTGSIISSLKANKKVIAFPRLKLYGEHVDDHQLELVKAFLKRGYILSANDKVSLVDAIKSIDKFTPEQYISNNSNIIKLINDYIINLK